MVAASFHLFQPSFENNFALSITVVLKLVGDIEPYKCRAGLHRTPSYNQEWI